MREFRVIVECNYVNYGSIEMFQRIASRNLISGIPVRFTIRDYKTDEVLKEEIFPFTVALKINPQEYCKRITRELFEQEDNPWKTKFEDLEAQVEDLLRFTREVKEGKVLPYPIGSTSDDRIKEVARFVERSIKIHHG